MAPLDSLSVGGVFSTILLLVIAYFGIRMAYTSGQLPERQVKTEVELAARFAADMQQAADGNRTDIEGDVRTLYARQQHDQMPRSIFCCFPAAATAARLEQDFFWAGQPSLQGRTRCQSSMASPVSAPVRLSRRSPSWERMPITDNRSPVP